jgi:tRNA A-37 threonylcarbamoyl transferase component Bud32
MDESKYESLFRMVFSAEQQDKGQHKLSQVINKLHEGGLFHGDIHDANLFIDRASLTRALTT